MCAYNPEIPLGSKETRIVTFAAPSALNVPVTGIDVGTNLTFLTLTTVNSLIRAIEDQPMNPAGGRTYEYQVMRDDYKIRTLYSNLCKAEIQGPIFPGLPLNLKAANYQIKMVQKTGAFDQPRNLTMVWQKSLG